MQEQTTSPVPAVSSKPEQLTLPQALNEVIDGKKITRIAWNNDHYCLLKEGFLELYRDSKFYQWIVNEGDLLAIDWVVVSDKN